MKHLLVLMGSIFLLAAPAAAQAPVHPVDRLRDSVQRTHRRVGPLWWRPVLELRGGIDSNPYQLGPLESERDTLAGVLFRMETALLLGRLAVIRGAGSVGYQHYFRFEALRDTPRAWSTEILIGLGPLGVDVGGDWTYRNYRYFIELDAPLRSDEKRFFVTGELPLGRRLFLRGGYQRQVVRVDIPEAAGLLAHNTFLDYTLRSAEVQIGLRLGHARVAGRFQRRWFRFDRAGTEARDWSLGLVWSLVSPYRGQAQVEVLYLHLTFDHPDLPAYRGLAAAARLDLRFTRRLWLVLGVDRGPQWSVFGPVYYRDTGVSMEAGVGLFRSWRLRGGYRWVWQDYRPPEDTPAPGVDQRWRGWQVGLDRMSGGVARFRITWVAWTRETASAFVAERRWMLTVTLQTG